ncbi:MAG: hypothetical protein ABSB81_06955 [Halobacteriota archaeon]
MNPKAKKIREDASGLRGAGSYATIMPNKTYSMNVSDMTEDEVDEAVSDALHGIVRATNLWQEKKSFHKKVTEALFDILKQNDLTIFDVLIKRDDKVCEILDEPTKDIPEGKMLEGSIDTETVKVYNLRSKDPNGNFELLYDDEFRKDIQMALYTDRKRIKM